MSVDWLPINFYSKWNQFIVYHNATTFTINCDNYISRANLTSYLNDKLEALGSDIRFTDESAD
jgi:hypothetical protein